MGAFTFNNTFTRSDPFTSSTGNTTGASAASLLLGVPGSGSYGSNTPYSLRQYYYATYVQDDWKITPRLTVNVGLRWELETPYRERYKPHAVRLRLQRIAGRAGAGLQPEGGDAVRRRRRQPELAGQPGQEQLRPRASASPGRWDATPWCAAATHSSTRRRVSCWTPPPASPPPSTRPPLMWPPATATPRPPTTSRTHSPTAFLPYRAARWVRPRGWATASHIWTSPRVSPYAQQWQFGVQHTLPAQVKLEVAFIRMLSLKGLENFDLNEKPDKYLAQGSAENTQLAKPVLWRLPLHVVAGQFGHHLAAATAVDGVPAVFQASPSRPPTRTNAAYNAVQLSLEKRLSHGLTILANYSISKLMENNITSLVNTRHYRSISALDRPHVVNVAGVYDLPFGHGRALAGGSKGVAGFLISNWSVSGRLYLASGTPLQITDTNGRPIRLRSAALSGSVEDRLGDRIDPATKQVQNPYFDVTAFQSLASQYTVSPEPPYFGELRAPRLAHDRPFAGEALPHPRAVQTWTSRADASNFTNTPQFAAPGTDFSSKGDVRRHHQRRCRAQRTIGVPDGVLVPYSLSRAPATGLCWLWPVRRNSSSAAGPGTTWKKATRSATASSAFLTACCLTAISLRRADCRATGRLHHHHPPAISRACRPMAACTASAAARSPSSPSCMRRSGTIRPFQEQIERNAEREAPHRRRRGRAHRRWRHHRLHARHHHHAGQPQHSGAQRRHPWSPTPSNIAMELSQRRDVDRARHRRLPARRLVLAGGHPRHRNPPAHRARQGLHRRQRHRRPTGGSPPTIPTRPPSTACWWERAKTRIVVADHSKLGVAATYEFWRTDRIDVLFTDAGAGEEALVPLPR